MSRTLFQTLLWMLGLGFAVAFTVLCVPPLMQDPDLIGAFAAGFVNPYASGYALDAILCWVILAVWITYEARTQAVKYGWIALLLGVVPGVATGFAAYLLLRLRQGRN